MTSITFYSDDDKQSSFEQTLVKLVTRHYRSGQRVFIRCDSQQQMLQIDEALWQLEANSFLAHALDGEPSAQKAPILLGSNNPQQLSGFACWVNLTQQAIVPIPRTEEIVELVPSDNMGIQLARNRFKTYCQQGVKPAFQELKKLSQPPH